jgi:hypothetical protein
VAAIKEEFLRADLTMQGAQQQLQNLRVSQDYVTALVARWNAQLQSKGTIPPAPV